MARHYTSLDNLNIRNTWLTIGSFDGVHLGHQHLISSLNFHAHQDGAESVVLTFHPHPSIVLRGRTGAFYLTTANEKAQLLDELKPDIVVTHPFNDEISQTTANDFVSYLLEHLHFKQLWVGNDFALGKGRQGNVEYLTALGRELNYKVNVIEPVTSDGRIISSSFVRNLLQEGKIEVANNLLGRCYRITGQVIHGDGRGKSIGIPTANLDTGDEKLIPGSGVYACRATIAGDVWPAAVNIGIRPTFESTDTKAHVEAHILDFDNDLYEQFLSIDFVSRLRGEQRFNGVDELINQIHVDIARTKEIIAELQSE